MTIETRKGNITLFACGGAGINVAKLIEPFRNAEELGMATISPVYIDTSLSNSKGLPPEFTWVFEGMDGSGKVRAENYQEISRHVRSILQKFPPGDLAIVLSSAHGGSGSVIAPSLVSELLGDGVPTVVITIGGTDSALEIKNTLNTLKSYEGVAQKRETPVVMAYFQNSKETPRAVVDRAAVELVSTLMTVFSRENTELDSMDLTNFLRFDKVTSYKPRVVGLVRYLSDQTENLDDLTTGNVITVVSVLKPGTSLDLNFTPEYGSIGYLNEKVNRQVLDIAPLSLVTLANTPAVVAKDMSARLVAIEKAVKARVDNGPILSNSDKPTDSGIVL